MLKGISEEGVRVYVVRCQKILLSKHALFLASKGKVLKVHRSNGFSLQFSGWVPVVMGSLHFFEYDLDV